MPFYQTNKTRGFTLLETIFAVAIILIAVIAIFGLVNFGISSIDVSKNKLIASELAQEGVELVRNWREKTPPWSNFYAPGQKGYYKFGINPATANGQPERLSCDTGTCTNWNKDTWDDAGISAISDPNTIAFFQLWYDPLTKLYTHVPTGVGNDTNFFRIIHLGASQDTDSNGNTDMKVVTVQVSWLEGSRLRSLKIVDHLYQWMNP